MKPIFVINAGSSSWKCSLYQDGTLSSASRNFPEMPLLGIGHRVVHGGSFYKESTIITQDVLKKLQELTELAPLHNGPAIEAIVACLKHYGPSVPQVAVFDTAFFSNMPEHSRYYAIPKGLADRYGIYRYGFHGISHNYLAKAYSAHTGKKDAKIITVHLGAGCSITATHAGLPIDTSMGFTPNEGLCMATRSGNIDPQVVQYVSEKEKIPQKEVLDLLNYESGLKGLSGASSDMKTLLEENSPSCRFAIELFCYRITCYIGAYIAALGGLDALIFSGGIGEHSPKIRSIITDSMHWYGLELRSEANTQAQHLAPGDIAPIHTPKSSVEIFVIATNENLEIAKEAIKLLTKNAREPV